MWNAVTFIVIENILYWLIEVSCHEPPRSDMQIGKGIVHEDYIKQSRRGKKFLAVMQLGVKR